MTANNGKSGNIVLVHFIQFVWFGRYDRNFFKNKILFAMNEKSEELI